MASLWGELAPLPVRDRDRERSRRAAVARTALLRDQIAVVTGAGSGIGRAIASTLGRQSAMVFLVGRTAPKLEETARGWARGAPAPALCPVDLSIDAGIQRLVADIEKRSDGLDVLVLAAGEHAHGSISDTPVEVFDRLWSSNVRANYVLVQKLLPMVKRRRGQIVFVNSSAGLGARASFGQYAATKHALKALTDALRGEVNADGVRVLSVYPGRTATPTIERLCAETAQNYQPNLLLQPADVAATILSALTLPRTAELTDISVRPLAKSY